MSLLSKRMGFLFSPLATHASRLTIEGLRYVYPPEVELYRRWAPSALRYFEVTMPAIASLEDLKTAQRRFQSMFLAASPNDLRLTIYSNILTLCSMLFALCGVLVSGSGTIER